MGAPDCANWKMWEGPEIEGYTDLNERTLFVRAAFQTEIVKELSEKKHTRLWLCDEYSKLVNNNFLEVLRKNFTELKIVIGCTYDTYLTLSKFVKENFQLYIQLNNLQLKKDDHIKVGNLFYEESFLMGQGKKSNPQLYSNDIKIL